MPTQISTDKVALDAKFTTLFPEINNKITAVAISLKQQQDAGDLVNIAYEHWLKKGDLTRTDAEIISYFGQFASWKIKSNKRYNCRFVSPVDTDSDDNDCDYLDSFADSKPSPEENAIKNSNLALLSSITETLAPADRRNLKAWSECGFIARAAAAVLGVSEVNISKSKNALKTACLAAGLAVDHE